MIPNKSFFFNKKILIYGLGKSGLSVFNFLKKQNHLLIFDDEDQKKNKFLASNKISLKNIDQEKFDCIILSPGIDIKKCKLSKILLNNSDKIFTDLDIFYSYYGKNNESIAITGTNGKSTTAQILYEILSSQKKDVRIVGNIGNPILSEKKISKNTFFVIETSSYQLEYSQLFRSKYSVILNISADHLERHGNLKNYINAKFKLLEQKKSNSIVFLNKYDFHTKKKIKSKKYNNRIINVDTKKNDILIKNINNEYFKSDGNKENLNFAIAISKQLRIKKKVILNSLKKFKGLKFRQQLIYEDKNLKVINDSKSTSFASTESSLKNLKNVYWILGGIPKKGDSFNMKKKECKNFKAFIFGKNYLIFLKELKSKINCKISKDIKTSLKSILDEISKKMIYEKITILFSPASASFDEFKNFEERGEYFNKLVNSLFNGKNKIN
tara:strand:+ start:1164 stop:2483 length:1320 start_codon:yes stop_codon:yes gene_type:complete